MDKILDYHLAKAADNPSVEVVGLYDSDANPRPWSFVVGSEHNVSFGDLPWYNRIRLRFTGPSYVVHNHPNFCVGSEADFKLINNGWANYTNPSKDVLGVYMIHTNPNAVYKNSMYHLYQTEGKNTQSYIEW